MNTENEIKFRAEENRRLKKAGGVNEGLGPIVITIVLVMLSVGWFFSK